MSCLRRMVDWSPHLLPPSPSRPPYIGDEQSESCEDDDEEEEEDIRERGSVEEEEEGSKAQSIDEGVRYNEWRKTYYVYVNVGGTRKRRSVHVPSSVDDEEQERFVVEAWEKIMKIKIDAENRMTVPQHAPVCKDLPQRRRVFEVLTTKSGIRWLYYWNCRRPSTNITAASRKKKRRVVAQSEASSSADCACVKLFKILFSQ